MRLIYLAGPYSHKSEEVRQQRLKQHAEILAYFANTADNLCLYSPIVHWHGVAQDFDLPHDFSFWMQQDFHMIKLATAMWVSTLDGWQKSYGLSQELEYARDIGREVFYVIPHHNEFHITDAEPTDA